MAVHVLLCAALVSWAGTRLAAQQPDVPEQEIDTAPIEIDWQVLFRVRGASCGRHL